MYCSQHHDNPSGSRFCRICGEPLTPAYPLLSGRYQRISELGQGGFGRTFLAKDLNRFGEDCVLKEFLPQVNSPESLQKAEELFQREAGVLYQLDHPQIPKFRELLRVEDGGDAKLFLVQDYVAGSTYRSRLEQLQTEWRRCFSETEVLTLLRQLLPVIHYIHSVGVIHRDIAPDNLIQRAADDLPILIDFGGVKQVAAAVEQALYGQPEHLATRLGKTGYAPHEQMQYGQVSPSSDLYALAATVVVLLTGQEPSQLIDPQTLTWHWQSRVQVSDRLAQVLNRALEHRPGDRYASAQDMMAALGFPPLAEPSDPPVSPPVNPAPVSPTPPRTAATVAVSPGRPRSAPPPASAPTPAPTPVPAPARSPAKPARAVKPSRSQGGIISTVILAVLTLGSVGGVWWLVTEWQPADAGNSGLVEDGGGSTGGNDTETSASAALNQRREELGVERGWFIDLVEADFEAQYPNAGTLDPNDPADADLLAAWVAIGNQYLDAIATHLTADSRRELGKFNAARRRIWRGRHEFSAPAHNDLTDAQFFQAFPDEDPAEFVAQARIDEPIGQIWQAIAFDLLPALEAGEGSDLATRVVFDEGAYRDQMNGRLEPGGGHVYLIGMQAGQQFRLSLNAAPNATKISVYRHGQGYQPAPLLEDSADSAWSTTLPENGFYEVVVVSDANAPVDYTLDVVAENISG